MVQNHVHSTACGFLPRVLLSHRQGGRLVALALLLLMAAPIAAVAQVATGNYTGNGTDNRNITGIGFQPDVVIVKSASNVAAVIRTSTMTGDNSKVMTTAVAFAANHIQSLIADGFQVGNSTAVNSNGVVYYWTAYKELPGVMDVGTYTGNGTGQSPTGVGFQPDVLWIISAGADAPLVRSSSMGTSHLFSGAATANAVTAFGADGFTVGTSTVVNTNARAYHYVAFKAVAGIMSVGSFTGNGTDNRNISGLGLQPQYMILLNSSGDGAIARSTNLGGDATLDFGAVANAANLIQALQADGFQVGTAVKANRNTATEYYMAWAETAIFISIASNNWSNTATWDRTHGTDADGIPDANDSVFITASHTVTLTADTSQRNTGISGTLVGANFQLRGTGNIILNAGGTVKTQKTTGINGLFTGTGTVTLDTAANYEFNGSSGQVTGTMMPAIVNNLTFNNSSTGVTLSKSTVAGGTITMTQGNVLTNTDTLSLGKSTSTLGTLSYTTGSVVGYFRRWFTTTTTLSTLFPVGTTTNYRPANLSYTSAPTTGGALTARFVASNPGTAGLPLDDAGFSVTTTLPDGYWTIGAGNNLAGGTYTLDLTARNFTGVTNVGQLRILKRANSTVDWALQGSHVTGTGTTAVPIVHRSGMSAFSDFAIGDNNDVVLPIELSSFDLREESGAVRLEWSTSAEIDNAGFEIQRMSALDTTWRAIASYVSNPELAGMGTSPIGKEYSYVDGRYERLAAGVYSYRLIDIALDGERTAHPAHTIAIGSAPSPIGMTVGVGPNPATGDNAALLVHLDGATTLDVDLLDATGRRVAVVGTFALGSGDHRVELPIASLVAGHYFVRVRYDGRAMTRKLERR